MQHAWHATREGGWQVVSVVCYQLGLLYCTLHFDMIEMKINTTDTATLSVRPVVRQGWIHYRGVRTPQIFFLYMLGVCTPQKFSVRGDKREEKAQKMNRLYELSFE